MDTTTTTTSTAKDLEAALSELRVAVEISEALAPLRRLLVDADEQLRAAARRCREAGLSERGIAARAEVAQPTVRDWLDGRQSDPLPAPALHERLWIYHQIASTLGTLVARVEAQDLPERAPTTRHIPATSAVYEALKALESAARLLRKAATSTEYAANH